MSVVTIYEKGQELQYQSTINENPTLFSAYPDVVYYGVFFSRAILDKIYALCPYEGRIAIVNPHLTLAHSNGTGSFDAKFLEEFYEKSLALRIVGFCRDDDVVLALIDPSTCPLSQSNPPHITLYRERAVNLKEAADKCAEKPKETCVADLKVRGQVRAWSTS